MYCLDGEAAWNKAKIIQKSVLAQQPPPEEGEIQDIALDEDIFACLQVPPLLGGISALAPRALDGVCTLSSAGLLLRAMVKPHRGWLSLVPRR